MARGTPMDPKEFKVMSVSDLGAGKLKFEMRDGDGVPCFTEVKPRPDQVVWSEGNALLIDSKGTLSKFTMRDAHLAVSCAMSLAWPDPLLEKDHPEPEIVDPATGTPIPREKAKFIELVATPEGDLYTLKDDGTVWWRGARGWEELK